MKRWSELRTRIAPKSGAAVSVRSPDPALWEAMKRAAREGHRSRNTEIVRRLYESLERDGYIG